jgi:DNA-binding SARP family transcriptional activator
MPVGAVEIRLLGQVGVRVAGGEVAVGGRQAQTLLALLASRADEVVTVDWLIDQLWLDRPPRTARATVQSNVSRLRGAVGSTGRRLLRRRCSGYLLELASAEVDIRRFEELSGRGREHAAAGRWLDALTDLRAALAVWRGTPFTAIDDVPALDAERARLEELQAETRLCELEATLRTGRPDIVIDPLRRFTDERPWDERPWQLLMLALYRAGRQTEALKAGAGVRRLLIDAQGLDPSPALVELERAILNHDAELEAGTRCHHNRSIAVGPALHESCTNATCGPIHAVDARC